MALTLARVAIVLSACALGMFVWMQNKDVEGLGLIAKTVLFLVLVGGTLDAWFRVGVGLLGIVTLLVVTIVWLQVHFLSLPPIAPGSDRDDGLLSFLVVIFFLVALAAYGVMRLLAWSAREMLGRAYWWLKRKNVEGRAAARTVR